MLKQIAMAILVASSAVSAFAQGQVNFNNNISDFATVADRFVYFGTGVAGHNAGDKVTGTNFKIQLYAGTAADSLSVVPLSAAASFRAATTSFPGTWSGGSRTLATPGGQQVFLQLKAWDGSAGATYESVAGTTAASGFSSVFTYTPPTSPNAPASDLYMEGFRTFNIVGVPEPSTFALAGLGILGLVMARRRK